MRRCIAVFFVVFLLLSGTGAAEQQVGPLLVSGEVEFGGRVVTGDDGHEVFLEYREIRSAPFGGGRFLIEDDDRRYYFRGRLDDVAEDDQEYRFRTGRYGRWGVIGSFSEIPHYFSKQGRTPYLRNGTNFTLPANFDRALAASDPAYAAQIEALGRRTKIHFRTYEGKVEAYAQLREDVKLSAGYRILDKQGKRPLALGFGSPGANFVNFASRVDEQIHEATFAAEWTRERWNLALNYTGSFFDNHNQSTEVDNPLQGSPLVPGDSATDVGRLSLAPDNSAHLVTLASASVLPTSFPARIAGSFSWGIRFQDQDFLPETSNSLIAGDPALVLPQNDLDGQVQTLVGNLVFSARPLPRLNLNARYRIYDYDNGSDEINFGTEVVNDQSTIRDQERRSIANSYTKQSFDSEAAWRFDPTLTAALGFEWESWNRSSDREVRHQNEYGWTSRIDWRAANWARLRTSYAFRVRTDNNYSWTAPFEASFPPAEVPSAATAANVSQLRKFDEADRDLHEFKLSADIQRWQNVSFTLSAGFDLADYDDSDFGLTDDRRWHIGFDSDYSPLERLRLFAYYTYDSIYARQKQLDRPFSGAGPFPWQSKTTDRAHTGGVGVNASLVPERLEAELSYFIQDGHAKTTAGGDAGAGAVNWPKISDRLQAVTATLLYHPFASVTFETSYRFEIYDQSNFTDVFPTTDAQGDIFLQNQGRGLIRDFTANIFSLSVIYRF